MIVKVEIYSIPQDATENVYFNTEDMAPELTYWVEETLGTFYLYEPGGILVATHSSFSGKYTNDDPFSDVTYTVAEFPCAIGNPDGAEHRRVSMKMTYEREEILRAIAESVGATWGGRGSWRTLVNQIAKGRLVVKQKALPHVPKLGQ